MDAQRFKDLFTEELITSGCFQTGSFTLKSGLVSPFYIDLRRLISLPDLLSLSASAYESLAVDLEFQHLAGIPVAGLPLATAAAIEMSVPMVFPRMTVKAHGTGKLVEGIYEQGDRVLLLDDLITTGGSKLEAAERLRQAGLVVEDLVVLIERGTSGRKEVEAAGMRLHSFVHVDELIERAISVQDLDEATAGRLRAFVKDA